mgnify:CR=1 FL=1
MADYLIPLSSELLDEVREISRDKNASLEDFVDLAVRERLERLWDEKLEAERTPACSRFWLCAVPGAGEA